MENEEKEVKTEAETPKETVEAEVVTPEEDSDFADQVKPAVEETKEETPVVEEEPEEEINLYAEKEEETPSVEEPSTEEKPAEVNEEHAKGESQYVYDDPELQGIEEARKNFHKVYKKLNIIKWIITGVGLALIVAGWLIPTLIKGINSSITMYISLGVTALVLVGIGTYSMIFRKKTNAQMKVYFKEYYEHNNAYVYPESIENLTGTVDDKLPEDAFLDSGIYKDVAKVGSRAYMTFDYKGYKGIIADAAAQKKGDRQLETLFVGKFIRFADITSSDANLLIYFKGNKRALPPNSLKGRKLIEDSKTMVIYGEGKAKSLLTKKVRDALSKFDTNKTFIDLAIAINDQGLFFALGYEDDLMVLPLEKPFNPAPTKQNKGDIEKILNFVDALLTRHEHN